MALIQTSPVPSTSEDSKMAIGDPKTAHEGLEVVPPDPEMDPGDPDRDDPEMGPESPRMAPQSFKMALDSPQERPKDNLEELLKEFKDVYDREAGAYRRCLKVVAEDLTHVLAQESIRHLPTLSRVKGWASVKGTAKRRQNDRLTAQEIQRKMIELNENWERHFDRYNMSKTELGYFRNRDELIRVFHDMLGARIVLYFPSDSKKVLELLKEAGYEMAKDPKRMGGLADVKRLRKLHAKWLDASASKAPADDLNLDGVEQQFSGYGAIHLAVKVPKRLQPRDLGPEAEIWDRRVVEIQVGTVMMHAWAEVEHDITYKSPGASPGREVTQDEKGVLDMLNGLAIASEVGLHRFRSPPSSPSPPAESIEELRSWLHQLYIRKKRSIPAKWDYVDELWDYLKNGEKNNRDAFQPLAEKGWSNLLAFKGGRSFEFDHVLPYIIMHGRLPADAVSQAPPPPLVTPDPPSTGDGSGKLRTELHTTANKLGELVRQYCPQDSQIDPHAKDKHGHNAAWYATACMKKLGEIIASLAATSGIGSNRATELGNAAPDGLRQAFFYAVVNGESKVVQFVIDMGGDVNWKSNGLYGCWSKYDVPALHIANYYGNEKLWQLLVKNGADRSAKDAYGNLWTAKTWGGERTWTFV
ncbi:uncharacterized protein B0H64DRAFT_80583 [Chaetomium fimeti]|uniref:RelA/SpoT domain-containing protein n=1 Tax=Chaetomium fimeti TaxID=1854472 RepID=A0AAE0HLD2_9PEZI|nr:hypothetical protein B0H64DRAFT_80583 [Chaetomium fimeti]